MTRSGLLNDELDGMMDLTEGWTLPQCKGCSMVLKNMTMSYISLMVGDFADLKDVVEHFGRTAGVLAAFVDDSACFWTGNRTPLNWMLHKYR